MIEIRKLPGCEQKKWRNWLIDHDIEKRLINGSIGSKSRSDPLMKKGETMDKALTKERLRSRKCPYWGADTKNLVYENIENDGKDVSQGVACTACEKQFTEVYSFCRVILTDYPGEDFRIDFNN